MRNENSGDKTTATVRGIVLAGVHQWDELALDAAIPRPLLPVAQQPLIAYVLDWMRAGGVTGVTVCANSASRLVRQSLGDGRSLGVDLDYYEDWTPRGPAGCVHDAARSHPGDVYVVADGAMIPRIDLAALRAAHDRARARITVAVDEAHSVTQAAGEPLQPLGVYIFDRAALEHVQATGYQDIKETLIPGLHRKGLRVAIHPSAGFCARVSGFDSYLAVQTWRLEELAGAGTEPAGYARRGEALVHHTARVDKSAALLGPVLIGARARVHEQAILVGPSAVGADCEIAARAVVSRATLWDQSTVGTQSLVDQCVIGIGVRIGSRARLYGRYVAPSQLRAVTPQTRSIVYDASSATDAPEASTGRRSPRARGAVPFGRVLLAAMNAMKSNL